jgi:hypothetical protein
VLAQTLEHGRVVVDDAPRIAECSLEFARETLASSRIFERVNLSVDVGLSRSADGLPAKVCDAAIHIALEREQRMQENELALSAAAKPKAHGVDDEWLIRCEYLDGRTPGALALGLGNPHVHLPGHALCGEIAGSLGELSKPVATAPAQLARVERGLELGKNEGVERVFVGGHLPALIGRSHTGSGAPE